MCHNVIKMAGHLLILQVHHTRTARGSPLTPQQLVSGVRQQHNVCRGLFSLQTLKFYDAFKILEAGGEKLSSKVLIEISGITDCQEVQQHLTKGGP